MSLFAEFCILERESLGYRGNVVNKPQTRTGVRERQCKRDPPHGQHGLVCWLVWARTSELMAVSGKWPSLPPVCSLVVLPFLNSLLTPQHLPDLTFHFHKAD